MSLAIDIDTVVKVCVAGKWHDVKFWNEEEDETVSSFHLDAYEYVTHLDPGEWPPLHTEHGGGEYGICAAGFGFDDEITGLRVSGPLTSIDAVMNDPSLSKSRAKESSVNGSSA